MPPLDVSGLKPVEPALDVSGLEPLSTAGLIPIEQPQRKDGGFFRGLKEGFVEGVAGAPESFGAGVEAYGRALGSPTIAGAGESITAATARAPEDRTQMVPLREAWRSPFTFVGQQTGQAVGSTLPTLVSGAAAAGAGGLMAGPGGVVIGGLLGSALPSLPMNTGDLYQQLVEEGVDKDRAAGLASTWGVVLTAPDVFSASKLLKPFIGTVTEGGSKGLAKLLAQRIKEGAKIEGLTELGQQGVQETIAGVETGNANLADRAERVATAGIAGTLGGGTVGGVGAVVESRRQKSADGESAPLDTSSLEPVAGAPEAGTVVGVRSGDTVERGVVEAIEGDTVIWRDESNALRYDSVEDFRRDLAEAPAARSDNATTVGEPTDVPEGPPLDIDARRDEVPDAEPSRRSGDEVRELRGAERAIELRRRAQREQRKLLRGDANALTQEAIDALTGEAAGIESRLGDPGVQPRGDEAGIVARQGELPLPDRAQPIKETSVDRLNPIEEAAAQTNTAPTEAQKAAGNYAKGRVEVQGIPIAIENPRGSERSGKDKGGRAWSVTMPAHYGYVERTEGKDGDQVDVYIGEQPDADTVYVVDQIDPETGKFDEHKAFLGFESQDAAEMTYASAFSDGSGPSRMGGVAAMSVPDFKAWVKGKGAKKPAASQSVSLSEKPQQTSDNLPAREGDDLDIPEFLRREDKSQKLPSGMDTTDDPSFKRWFGKSKAVDKTGKPLVVYHGTDKDFDEFKMPAFFTPSKEGVDWYASKEDNIEAYDKYAISVGGRVLPVHLSISNPLDVHSREGAFKFVALAKRAGVKIDVKEHPDGSWEFDTDEISAHSPYEGHNINDLMYSPRVREQMAKEGYDGLYASDVLENTEIDIWIPLKPTQIKSAIGNRGTYDPTDPSILRSGLDPTEVFREIGRIFGRASPRDASRAARLPVGNPGSLNRLSAVGRFISFASGLASRDRASARLFSAYLDRDKLRETLERQAVPMVKPYMDLPPASMDRVNKVLEHDRIAGVDRKDTGRRVVVRPDASVKLELTKPGETVSLTAEETKAFHAIRKFTDQRLMDIGAAMAREQGYTGDFSTAGIKAFTGSELAAARAAQILEAVTEARRRGYVPLNRYGDYYIKILPKPADVPGRDSHPPSLRDGRFEFVDTSRAFSALLSERAGRSPQSVADRVRALEKQYPRSRFTYEVGRVTPKQITTLDIPLIEKLFAAVNFHDPAVGSKLYDEILSQVYAERLSGFRKQSENIPGYSTDFERSIADYVRQSSAVIANMEHGKPIQEAYDAIQQHPDANIREFWKKHKDHIESSKGDFAALRKFGFFNFLWGSPSSALINLTQTPLVTGFQLGSWAGVLRGQGLANAAGLEAVSAIRPTAKGFALDFDKVGKTPAERQMLAKLKSDGTLDPVIAAELQGADIARNRKLRAARRSLERVYDLGASMFNAAEQANRVAAALAYFRAAQAPQLREKMAKVYKDDQLFKERVGRSLDPTAIAAFGVDETQFIGGKLNRQPIQRGAGSLALQFQQYNANYLRLLYKNFTRMGHEGKIAGSLMLISLVAAGGLLGAPFADDLLGGIQWAYKTATGIDPLLERRLAQFLADDAGMGPYGAEMVMRGPSRASGDLAKYLGVGDYISGVDLSKRVGMGDIVPKNDAMDLLGPVASATFGRLIEAFQRYSTGQPIAAGITAAQALIGKGPADLLRGTAQLPEEGYSTLRGEPVVMPSEITGGEQAARSLGFQPSRFARRSESAYEDRRVAEATKEAPTRLLTSIGRELALAEDARKAGDSAAVRRHEQRADAILQASAEAFEGDGPDWSKVPPPTAKAIRQRAQRFVQPVESRLKSAGKTKREEMGRSPFVRE